MIITRSRTRAWALLAGLAAVLLLAACSSSSSSSGSSTAARASSPAASAAASGSADTIIIKNFAFSPASLTVAPGAVVTVRNEDSVTHTLTDKSDKKLFDTGDIAANQSESFKAPKSAGSYPYICTIHQYMSGTLIVR